jgi:excisionase family DNA binding protein
VIADCGLRIELMPEERENLAETSDSPPTIRDPQSVIRNQEILTIEQVAEYLQLHPQVVYRHVRAGTLPASRIGRTIRFKKSVLDAFLERDAWEAAGRFLAFVENEKSRAAAAHAKSISINVERPIPKAEPERPEIEEPPPKKFSVDVD